MTAVAMSASVPGAPASVPGTVPRVAEATTDVPQHGPCPARQATATPALVLQHALHCVLIHGTRAAPSQQQRPRVLTCQDEGPRGRRPQGA